MKETFKEFKQAARKVLRRSDVAGEIKVGRKAYKKDLLRIAELHPDLAELYRLTSHIDFNWNFTGPYDAGGFNLWKPHEVQGFQSPDEHQMGFGPAFQFAHQRIGQEGFWIVQEEDQTTRIVFSTGSDDGYTVAHTIEELLQKNIEHHFLSHWPRSQESANIQHSLERLAKPAPKPKPIRVGMRVQTEQLCEAMGTVEELDGAWAKVLFDHPLHGWIKKKHLFAPLHQGGAYDQLAEAEDWRYGDSAEAAHDFFRKVARVIGGSANECYRHRADIDLSMELGCFRVITATPRAAGLFRHRTINQALENFFRVREPVGDLRSPRIPLKFNLSPSADDFSHRTVYSGESYIHTMLEALEAGLMEKICDASYTQDKPINEIVDQRFVDRAAALPELKYFSYFLASPRVAPRNADYSGLRWNESEHEASRRRYVPDSIPAEDLIVFYD